jgi:hypothetical protein
MAAFYRPPGFVFLSWDSGLYMSHNVGLRGELEEDFVQYQSRPSIGTPKIIVLFNRYCVA